MSKQMCVWVMGLLALASVASATSRDETIANLDAVLAASGSDAVRVRVNDAPTSELRLGDAVVYAFDSSHAGYLTAVHIDPHGGATLLYPRAEASAGRLQPGTVVRFPSEADGFTVEVQAPIGRDLIYAFVTDEPVSRSDLGISDPSAVVAFEPGPAVSFADRLRTLLSAIPKAQLHANKMSQITEGRGSVKYRSADIIDFFSTRTRALEPPRLDLQVQFQTNSANLDATARRNIDEFAAALSDSRLRRMRFAVAGHTDDRGTEEHNDSLSRARARSVQKYLVESGGIDVGRLEIEAYGERQPLLSEESEYAREVNRRVEFTPIR